MLRCDKWKYPEQHMSVTRGVAGVGLTSPHRELRKDTQDTRLLYWEYCPRPPSSSHPGVPLARLPDDHVKNSGEEEGCGYSIIVNIWVMSALEMWESWVRPSEGLGLLPGGSACSPGQARGRQTAATVFIIRSHNHWSIYRLVKSKLSCPMTYRKGWIARCQRSLLFK